MATYKERWEAYFDILEQANQGFISLVDADMFGKCLAESLGYPPGSVGYQETLNIARELLWGFLSAFAIDKDARLSKGELLKSVETFFANKDAQSLPEFAYDAYKRFFNLLDRNKSGELSLEEFKYFSKRFGSNASDEEIQKAFDHAITIYPTKDLLTHRKFVAFVTEWTSAPHPAPEFEVLIPFFKRDKNGLLARVP